MMRRFFGALFIFFSSAWLFAGELLVSYLDCGQGDAAVVLTPGGKTYLIDTGPNEEEYGGTFDAGKKVVVPYLLSRRTDEIEGILITHRPYEAQSSGVGPQQEACGKGEKPKESPSESTY